LVARINASPAGVTASYDGATRTLTLANDEAGAQAITLADSSGNFLQAMKLIDGGGAKIGTETAGTDMPSLSDVVAMINGAGIGVTASVVNDAHGRANLLEISSDDGLTEVRLGSGGDTSNFLEASHLLTSPSGVTRTSTRGLAGVNANLDMVDARLATALAQTSGSFTINGVQFTYDAENE